MAQSLNLSTSMERRAATADARHAYGKGGGNHTVCLTRGASDWSRDSRLGQDELRTMGLAGARAGWAS